jgi:alanine racemase
MTVVKADAYGHGLKQIAALLMQSGTDIFGVANLAEAQSIRSVGKGWPILMLGAVLPHEIPALVRDNVMPTISSLAEAEAISTAATHAQKTVDVHLKIDTGMGRLGVIPQQAWELAQRIRALAGLKLQGLYTHFSSIEDDADYSRRQADAFRGLVRDLTSRGIDIPWIHASNSGALLHEPDALFNVVRPGLLVYGVIPTGQRHLTTPWHKHIHPALSWKCRVSLVKNVPSGTSLSYGHTYTTDHPMQVATLTAGYGDGYLRAASNRGEVLIRGTRCQILGRVTMDQMLADVSHIPTVQSGDEVVLIGRQGKDMINVDELAGWMGTIAWEVFTSITYRVPRIYRGSQAS